ncbi:MAG: sigma-54-dependent Fis family transcriptional regulator [Alphaproteobacteria bacterium]|nr:sigma-54-dependent Fis family transcriptional regulator [Alphaproteobacteria bacterium]
MTNDILIVDDEKDIRMLVSGVLEDEGYETREAKSSAEALSEVRSRQPSLVILDIWLEGSDMDGLEVLEAIKAEHPAVPVLIISGHGNIETAVMALKKGAYDFLEKPFKADRLLVTVARAIEAAKLKKENLELKQYGAPEDELIGVSAAVTNLRQMIERAAPTDSRVLITGAAGVGKEIVARMIHNKSKRKNAPFVVLNCAAMRPDRMEEELFGVEPEARRKSDVLGVENENATSRKIGTFEQAHGGTLLLDEVGDMPLETQSKIVRVLQDQTFQRVGGIHNIRVDVRVIATSNKDLMAEIQAGRFREDLYYRLDVVPIKMPALYERVDDIPLLAEYFMHKAAVRAGVSPRPFSEDAVAAIKCYDWPGNGRQLRNVVDWILVMYPQDRGVIRADMLPKEMEDAVPEMLRWEKSDEMMGLPLRDAREMFEKEYLLAQKTRFNGNVSKTAEFVGMERSALHRKLKSLGIDKQE